jgi:hypothetical protein
VRILSRMCSFRRTEVKYRRMSIFGA